MLLRKSSSKLFTSLLVIISTISCKGPKGDTGPIAESTLPVFSGIINNSCVTIQSEKEYVQTIVGQNYKNCPALVSCDLECWTGPACVGPSIFPITLPITLATENCNLVGIGMTITLVSNICLNSGSGDGSVTVQCS